MSPPQHINSKEKYPPSDFTFLILGLKFIGCWSGRGEVRNKKGIVLVLVEVGWGGNESTTNPI